MSEFFRATNTPPPECFGCDNWYQAANCDGGGPVAEFLPKSYRCNLPESVLGEKPRTTEIADPKRWNDVVVVAKHLRGGLLKRPFAVRAMRRALRSKNG